MKRVSFKKNLVDEIGFFFLVSFKKSLIEDKDRTI